MKFKSAPLMAICLISLLIISGCVSDDIRIEKKVGTTGEDDTQTKVTVNWLARWKDEHKREDLINDIAMEFEILHPEIDINQVFFQDAGMNSDPDVAKKIVEMIESGNIEWDIVIANTGTYGDVAEMLSDSNWGEKYLVNFLEVEGFRETQKQFILDGGYLDEYGGVLVGPYIEGFYLMLWYNQEVADEMGIEVKQHGMTLEDFLGYLKAVQDYNNEHGTNVSALYEGNSDWRTTEYMFQHLFKSAVGDFKRVKETELTEEKKAALLRTFKAFEQMSQYSPLLAGHDDRAWYDTRAMSFDGTVLFTVNGAWMYSHWMDMDEEGTMNMYPAELPVFPDTNTDFYIGSFIPQYAVMKDSPNKDAAIELIKFISSPKIAEKWVRYTKAPTGIKGEITETDVGEDQFESFQAEVNERFDGKFHFSDNAGYMLGEENKLLDSIVDELMIDVLDGEITGQQAYDQLMAEIEKS